MTSVAKMSLKITDIKFCFNPPGTNELTNCIKTTTKLSGIILYTLKIERSWCQLRYYWWHGRLSLWLKLASWQHLFTVYAHFSIALTVILLLNMFYLQGTTASCFHCFRFACGILWTYFRWVLDILRYLVMVSDALHNYWGMGLFLIPRAGLSVLFQ